ncbi:hypothetical protein O3P69_001179 [Scylla paramamosain]|uniref:Uncharacterized protein n=1 Tax=Scylla paramamosain TaxID=85552 RepID=A0AAW0UPU2_SCYPA
MSITPGPYMGTDYLLLVSTSYVSPCSSPGYLPNWRLSFSGWNLFERTLSNPSDISVSLSDTVMCILILEEAVCVKTIILAHCTSLLATTLAKSSWDFFHAMDACKTYTSPPLTVGADSLLEDVHKADVMASHFTEKIGFHSPLSTRALDSTWAWALSLQP